MVSIRRLTPRPDEVFRLHPQGVSDAGDVVEVGDHLDGVVDGPVVQTVDTQGVQVSRRHVMLVMGELDGELTQRAVNRVKRCAAPIPSDGVHKGIGFRRVGDKLPNLFTEVMRMRLRSVVTTQFG